MDDPCACRLRSADAGIRGDDALDLAREIAQLARQLRCPVLLFVFPDGAVQVTLTDEPEHRMLTAASLSLVGVYTHKASAEEIRDDILAMPRGWGDAP